VTGPTNGGTIGGTIGGTTGGGSGGGSSEGHILTAREVSIPIIPTPAQDVSPELLRLRSDFLAGKQLSREDMGELLRMSAESGGGSNTNCGIC